MANEGIYDHGVAIRNLLANIQTGDNATSGGTDCMAQLLAAAVAQFGNSNTLSTDSVSVDPHLSVESVETEAVECAEDNLNFNPEGTEVYEDDSIVDNTVEVPTTVKRKLLCVKFPVELRKRIIAMRKEGKKCVEVAKELRVSVSGAQKVWERFLATGTIHDRKPSTYAGRPRKYMPSQVSLGAG